MHINDVYQQAAAAILFCGSTNSQIFGRLA
jgi:hypothetical protein